MQVDGIFWQDVIQNGEVGLVNHVAGDGANRGADGGGLSVGDAEDREGISVEAKASH